MSYDASWEGVLEALAPNVWWVWSVMASPPMPRNMTVVRLASGGLLLHSPVCLAESAMSELAPKA